MRDFLYFTLRTIACLMVVRLLWGQPQQGLETFSIAAIALLMACLYELTPFCSHSR